MTVYEIDNYQIRPYANDLCWEVFQKREVRLRKDGKETGETDTRWVSLDCYPSTFQHALQIVAEHRLKDGNKTLQGLKDAITHVDTLYASLLRDMKEVSLGKEKTR